jgi:uncharacterized phosphatase
MKKILLMLLTISLAATNAQASHLGEAGLIRGSRAIMHLSFDKALPQQMTPIYTGLNIFEANGMSVSLHPYQSPLLGRLFIRTKLQRWEQFSAQNWLEFQAVFRASTLMLNEILYKKNPDALPKDDNQLFNMMGYEQEVGDIVFEICPRLPADQTLIYGGIVKDNILKGGQAFMDPCPGRPLTPAILEASPWEVDVLSQKLLFELRASAADPQSLSQYRQNGAFPELEGCEVCQLSKNSPSIFYSDPMGGYSLALDPRSQASNPGRAFFESHKHYTSFSYLSAPMLECFSNSLQAYLRTLYRWETNRPIVDLQALMNLKGDVTPHLHIHFIPNRGKWSYYDFSQNKPLPEADMADAIEGYKRAFREELEKLAIKNQNLILPYRPFILIRHGETDANVAKKIQGQQDTPLNTNGRLQAQILQEALKGIHISDVFSSPLARATETAEVLCASLGVSKLYLHDGLMERSFGKSEGSNHPAGDLATIEHPDAEPADLFRDRSIRAVRDILGSTDFSASGIPAIVTHGGVVKSIALYLGLKQEGTSNAVPMLFMPPETYDGTWKMKYLAGQ